MENPWRSYELYEENLIEMFKLCTNEEVDRLDIVYDIAEKRWRLQAKIIEVQK